MAKKLSPSQKNPSFKTKDLSRYAFINAGKFYSHTPTDEQIKMTRQLFRRIQNRIIVLRKHPELPQTAVEYYNKHVLGKVSKINQMSKHDLTELFDSLRHIESLKSSSVRGAKLMNEYGTKLYGKKYSDLSESKKKAFWELFNKLKEVYGINKGSQGSTQLQKELTVVNQDNFVQFRQLRDKKGRFTGNWEAYLVDSGNSEIEFKNFRKDVPINLQKAKEFDRVRKELLLKNFRI